MQRVTQMKIGFVWACHADKRRHMRDWKSIQLVLACYNGAAVGKYRWPELRVTSCTAQEVLIPEMLLTLSWPNASRATKLPRI
eukprot:4936028-Pleurochrysis_carterae.AAC.8